jgi:hypothetical protein
MAIDYNQLLANPEASAFASQRKLAEMLLKQGSQTPQGQMIGNIYVGASPWQMLGNLAQQYSGQLNLEDADKKEMAYAKALRQQDLTDLQKNMELYQGTKEKFTELAGPYLRGSGLQGADVMPMAYMPEQEANPQAAMAQLLGSSGPKSSALGGKLLEQMFKQPKWEKTSIKENGQEIFGVYDANNPNVRSTFVPYNVTADIPTLNAQYSGVLPSGMTNTTPSGVSSSGTTLNKNAAPVNYSAITSDPRLQKTMAFENPTGENITSKLGGTAHGPFQINQGTFNLVTSKVPELKGITFDQFKQDIKLQEKVGTKLHDFNDQTLTSNGVPLNDVTRQAMWFSGNPAFAKAVENPQLQNQPVINFLSPEQAQANKVRPDYTIGQFRNDVSAKTSQVGQPTSKISSKYELEVPKQFNTMKERDEWFAKSREPLTGEPLKMVTGAENTIVALRDFSKGLQNFDKADLLNPNKVADMTSLSKNALLSLKDAKNLGVLNKEDLPQLEAILRNPADIKNILNSKELFQKLADRQIEFAGNVVSTTYKNSYKQMPESTKQKLTQIDSEVAERQTANVQKSLDKPLVYTSPESVEAAGKSGRIKDGQLIIIGNQKFRYKKD